MSQSQQRNRPTKAPMRGRGGPRRPPMGSGTGGGGGGGGGGGNQQQQQQQQKQRSRANRNNRGRGRGGRGGGGGGGGGGGYQQQQQRNYGNQYQNNQSTQNQAQMQQAQAQAQMQQAQMQQVQMQQAQMQQAQMQQASNDMNDMNDMNEMNDMNNMNNNNAQTQPKKQRSRPPVKTQSAAMFAQFNAPQQQQQQQQQQQNQAVQAQVQAAQAQQAQAQVQMQEASVAVEAETASKQEEKAMISEIEIREEEKAAVVTATPGNTSKKEEMKYNKKPAPVGKQQPPWIEFTGTDKSAPIKCGWAHRVRQVLSADTLRIALLKPRDMDPLLPPKIITITLDGIVTPRCQRWDPYKDNQQNNNPNKKNKKSKNKKNYNKKDKADNKDESKSKEDEVKAPVKDDEVKVNSNKKKANTKEEGPGPKPATMSQWEPPSEDEPYAYAAREFVRNKILNKNIFYAVWRSNNMSGLANKSTRYWGDIYYQENKHQTKSLTSELISAGYAHLKSARTDLSGHETKRLKKRADDACKSAKNIWTLQSMHENPARIKCGTSDGRNKIRKIEWIAWNKQSEFGFKYKGKILHGVVDQVISGSTIRMELCMNRQQNDFKNVVVKIAGVTCPKVPQMNYQNQNKRQNNRNNQNRNKNRKESKADKLAKRISDYFGFKSREWSEERLLGQIVSVKILFVSNKQIIAQIIHEKGRIGPSLLKKGLGQYESWTAKQCDGEEQRLLIAASDLAKSQRLNIWSLIDEKDIISSNKSKQNDIRARVIQVISGDTVKVQYQDMATGKNIEERYTLSSIRAPRLGTRGGYAPRDKQRKGEQNKYEAKYATPDEYLSRDAKEFVRQKCIGNIVKLVYEYSREAEFKDKNGKSVKQEKKFASIYILNDEEKNNNNNNQNNNKKNNNNEMNVAIELLKRGYAELVYHSKNDFERSEDYALLEAAFDKAREKQIGLNAYTRFDKQRNLRVADDAKRRLKAAENAIADYSGIAERNIKEHELVTLNQYLKSGRIRGVIEFIFGANRVKVYIPSRRVCIAVRLAGIRCGDFSLKQTDPNRTAAKKFLNDSILQRDIELQITSLGASITNNRNRFKNKNKGKGRGGRGGGNTTRNPNLDGHIYLNGKNVSEYLLQNGWASIITPRYNYNDQSQSASQAVPATFKAFEKMARDAKLGVWKNDLNESDHKLQDEQQNKQRIKSSKTGEIIEVMVSYVESATTFWVNDANSDAMVKMNEEMQTLSKTGCKAPDKIRPNKSVRWAAKYDGHYARCRVTKRDKRNDEDNDNAQQQDENKKNNQKNNNQQKKESNWFVMFVDYGNKASISRKQFTELPQHLRTDCVPVLAKKCQLTGISVYKKNNRAFNDAGWFFNRHAFQSENQKLKMKILYDDQYNKLWHVELFVANKMNESINQLIAREGFVRQSKDLPYQFKSQKEYGQKWDEQHCDYCKTYFQQIKENIKSAKDEHRNIWYFGDIDSADDDNLGDRNPNKANKRSAKRGR